MNLPRSTPHSSLPWRPEELEQGLAKAGRLLSDFYRGLERRPVPGPTHASQLIDDLQGTLGEDGAGLPSVMDEVQDHLLPNTMAIPHPLYLGLINCSPLPAGIVADALVSGVNNNAGAWEQAPSFVAAEHEVVRCFADLLGLAPGAHGIVLPGGSYTALHALQLAREAKLPQWRTAGPQSLDGPPTVYVSGASHFSAARAAMAVGVGADHVISIDTQGRGAMDPKALRTRLLADLARGARPFALVATLGTTGTGAIDPLEELADLAEEFDLWLHVDACYGGAAALVEALQPAFRGMERADSVAVDPHKWFFVPMVAGLLLTPHGPHELRTFDVNASYIPDGALLDGYRRALPTSRRSSGFAIWMTLRAHGLAAIRSAVERHLRLARQLETLLQAQGLRVLEGGELAIVCARWEPAESDPSCWDELQGRLAERVVAGGKAWFGLVQTHGKPWLRFCLASLFTRPAHLEELVQELLRCARELEADQPEARPAS